MAALSAVASARPNLDFENNYFTEMCSGSEAGSYLRRIDFVHHSTLGLSVITKKRRGPNLVGSKASGSGLRVEGLGFRVQGLGASDLSEIGWFTKVYFRLVGELLSQIDVWKLPRKVGIGGLLAPNSLCVTLRGQQMPSPRPWKMIRYFHSTVRNPR